MVKCGRAGENGFVFSVLSLRPVRPRIAQLLRAGKRGHLTSGELRDSQGLVEEGRDE